MIRCDRTILWRSAAVFVAVLISFTSSQAFAVVEPVMTDLAISDKIEDELTQDPGVDTAKINVVCLNGIVTLNGDVNNILAKDRATRIAEIVRGVRAVVNRIKVVPSAVRSDYQIKRDVETALLSDPATDSYEIRPTIREGIVTLNGTVNSYREAQLVRIVTKGVRGVTDIVDQINIDYQSNRPDLEIQTEIQQSLRWDVHVDHNLITATVDKGKVSLSGTVGSAAEKRFAESNAWVAGVKSVDSSKLMVEKWARDPKLRGSKYVIKTAEELKNAIQDALMNDPRVMSFKIDPTVAGSVVTLRGTVDNLKAKRAAEQDAKNTVGVSRVYNRIKVRLDSIREDVEVANDIREALQRDPYIGRFEVIPTVLNGTAYLYGTVDSQFEKNHAGDVASRVLGVLNVKNYLAVDDNQPYFTNAYVDGTTTATGDWIGDYERRVPGLTDADLVSSIESEMWWSPFVDSDEVTVTVVNGVATLTGTVDSWSERRAATENAYEGGATLVNNELAVK